MKTDDFIQVELPQLNSLIKKRINEKNLAPIFHSFPQLLLNELIDYLICEKIFYFKSKYNNFSFLGLGYGQTIKANELSAFTSANPNFFLIASFLFEENPEQAEFILPEWAFINDGKNTQLIISTNHEYQTFVPANLFFNTNFELNCFDNFVAPWTAYEEYPEHDQWTQMIETSKRFFDEKKLQKIVLSRKKIFEYLDPIEPIAFFKSIFLKNNQAISSYAIFYQKNFSETFISLSPEKLFSINGNIFESISLAASAPRGDTANEDAEFEKQLQKSDKLIYEQKLVTEEIIKKITPLCLSIKQHPLETMKLPYIQHRATPISAILKENIGPLELITTLHPTPAVGGLPTQEALVAIKELEPFIRNHYAAPIGIINSQFSEFAVGIRSALIELNKISLFGGAGIISGSNSEEEWNETATKMSPYLKVINHE